MISMSMVPWRWRERPRDERMLMFASRFDDRTASGRRDPRVGLAILRRSFGIRAQALRSDGVHGIALYARPLRGKYYTVSAWRDDASVRSFARTGAHRDGARAVSARGPVSGVLISWWVEAGAPRPRWREVLRRTAEATPGPYAGPAGPAGPAQTETSAPPADA